MGNSTFSTAGIRESKLNPLKHEADPALADFGQAV